MTGLTRREAALERVNDVALDCGISEYEREVLIKAVIEFGHACATEVLDAFVNQRREAHRDPGDEPN